MPRLTRRQFLGVAAAGTGALVSGCIGEGPTPPSEELIARLTIKVRPDTPTLSAPVGYSQFDFGGTRDGFFYVPTTYVAATPAPLVMLLHGAGDDSTRWRNSTIQSYMESLKMILVSPDSRVSTWDLLVSGYGPDIAFMEQALGHVFARCNVHPDRITIGGFSDGASEALGVGIANAGLITRIIAFSPGVLVAPFSRGYPRVFVSHGDADQVISPANTRENIVPRLRANGMPVEFVQFQGGHSVPAGVEQRAFEWMTENVA